MTDRCTYYAYVVAAALLFESFTALASDDANDFVSPALETLLDLDRQTIEAFFDGNGDRYGQFLSDSFVMYESGYRLGKADAISVVSAIDCQARAGWDLNRPQLTRVSGQVYVLSYERNLEGACTVAGIASRLPTPVRAATLWLRSGDTWLAAYHGENSIVNPEVSDSSASEKVTAPKHSTEDPMPTVMASESVPSEAMSLTMALLAVEASVWETWRMHDARALQALTAAEISFVNIFGEYFADKTATIENWTGPLCDVDSFALKDGHASWVTPSVGILTVKGTVTGSCGGQDISGQEIYVTSIYVNVAGSWKWAFGFNSP